MKISKLYSDLLVANFSIVPSFILDLSLARNSTTEFVRLSFTLIAKVTRTLLPMETHFSTKMQNGISTNLEITINQAAIKDSTFHLDSLNCLLVEY